MECQSDKIIFVDMLKTLRNDSYYMPRFMDLFFDLSSPHQKKMTLWFHKHINKDDWDEWAKDPYMYPEIIKGTLMHYSGREEFDEPTKHDLMKLIGEYCRSAEFDTAEETIKTGETKSLKEMLKEDL